MLDHALILENATASRRRSERLIERAAALQATARAILDTGGRARRSCFVLRIAGAGAVRDGRVDRVHEKMSSGALPLERPVKTWGGKGAAGICDGCDQPLALGEVELEAEFETGRTLRFHVRCFIAWNTTRGPEPHYRS
jgi:hypothetical protein